jgi:hypothetical protein
MADSFLPEIVFLLKFDEKPLAFTETGWIEAHDSVNLGAHFGNEYKEVMEDQIECHFAIFDTHKKNGYTVKAISLKVERPPLQPKPLIK